MINTDINKLSSLEIAGQLVMPRIDFDQEGHLEKAIRLVEDYKVGGFIIFNGEVNQVRKAVLKLGEISELPLFFGIDAERGLGQMVDGGTRFPFLMSQGASENFDLVKGQAVNTAREMKYCGLNLLFGPVLDINTNPRNPIINVRAFGDDPELVSKLGSIFYNTLKNENIFACGKHFPGHGSTDADSHVVLPVIEKTAEELSALELIPFREAVDSGIDFIMAGHLAAAKVDKEEMPATLSRPLITGLLRKELGFEKAVITDSFRMDALKEIGPEDKVAIKSLEAGCDIILDPVDGESLVEKLAVHIEDSQDFSLRAKKSVEKLFSLKKNIQPPSDSFPDRTLSKELVAEIARKSVCLLKGKTIQDNIVDVNIYDVTNSGKDICDPFIRRLKQNDIQINTINFIANESSYKLLNKFDSINVVITTVAAWTQNSQLTFNFKKVLADISRTGEINKILISFGSPYVIADFLDYTTIISSFEVIEPCQVETADVLTGKTVPDSKLPVKF